jgi:hypothetical protein
LTKSSGPMTRPSSASSKEEEGGGVGERWRRCEEDSPALYFAAYGAGDTVGVMSQLVYLRTACFFAASEQTMHTRRSARVSGTGWWTLSLRPPISPMGRPPRPARLPWEAIAVNKFGDVFAKWRRCVAEGERRWEAEREESCRRSRVLTRKPPSDLYICGSQRREYGGRKKFMGQAAYMGSDRR